MQTGVNLSSLTDIVEVTAIFSCPWKANCCCLYFRENVWLTSAIWFFGVSLLTATHFMALNTGNHSMSGALCLYAVLCTVVAKKTISCIAYPALWSIHTLHAWTGLRLLNSKHNYYKLGSACAKTKLVWSCKYLDSKSRRWFCFHPTLKNTCDWWSLGFSRNASKKYHIYWSTF